MTKFQIKHPSEIGEIVRRVRKREGVRQDDLAAMAGVSEGFLGKIESGGSSQSIEKLFAVFDELGIRVVIDTPDELIDLSEVYLKNDYGVPGGEK